MFNEIINYIITKCIEYLNYSLFITFSTASK